MGSVRGSLWGAGHIEEQLRPYRQGYRRSAARWRSALGGWLLTGHQCQSEEGERPPDQGLAPQPPRSSEDRSGLAKEINPQVQDWINYYGAFYRSELRLLAWRINEHLARWAMHKFKRFRGKYDYTSVPAWRHA